MSTRRPEAIFDRDPEWRTLVEFARDDRGRPALGFVFGRRRQGKTLLLDSLCAATGGFYHGALEEEDAVALRRFGETVSSRFGVPAPLAFADWVQAIDALFRLGGTDRPELAVIDEFPFLVDGNRSIPSIVQRAFDQATIRGGSRLRLILCGSAISAMTRFMSGSAPLYGRAIMSLAIHPFDFRTAARFWGLEERPDVALRVHAIFGGTPAYRLMLNRDVPTSLRAFDAWVERALLSTGSSLFTEGRTLLWEEPIITDRSLYSSVLAAIAEGRTRRGEIAAYLGREQAAVNHPLKVLEELRLVRQEQDAFRKNRATFLIAEPIIRFFHAVIRPNLAELNLRRADEVWTRVRTDTFPSLILGPHLEEMARHWAAFIASRRTIGGEAGAVAPTKLNDPAEHSAYQVDVVVTSRDRPPRVLAVGESKWGANATGAGELRGLERIRELMSSKGLAERDRVKLLLFGGNGFSPALQREAAVRDDVELIDLERLYHGE